MAQAFHAYSAFRPCREHGFENLRVEGTLPPELAGTLYRIGPGRFEAFGERFGHWFDGDGMVTAIRFENGRASGACRMMDCVPKEEQARQERFLGRYGLSPKKFWDRLAAAWSYK